ncbi:MAG: diaminopimelate decarboxylase [Archaeoglobales archaeon]|jgi:diaminopimelate decarboxylase|nr:diaminopimelate decarboxylase [Archaeoglobi archaeon]NHW23441.1 diaminopimelate decarboxylase [Archaeoglobales archaeon]
MFSRKNGILFIEDVSTVEIAEKYGTPVYVTSKFQLEKNIEAYKKAFPKAEKLYAVKANGNLALMRIIASNGFGADVFSSGELYLSLLAGFSKQKILFNGNSKSDSEIEMGIQAGVKFSVDSLDELETIQSIAEREGKEIEIAFRINPDIDPKTHPKIATGLKESKFGLPEEQALKAYEMALRMKNVVPKGIHCHIGSQILETSPFISALRKLGKIAKAIENLGVELDFIDIGGGLGIDYEGKGAITPHDLAKELLPVFEEVSSDLNSDPMLWLEPGRSIVGNTTVLLTRVNAVKRTHRNFVAVDAGFNLLIRPAMYGSYHRVVVANRDGGEEEIYTVVGPICESGDVLARDRKLPKVEKGDLIAILDAGAYGFSMSSQYNGRPRCAEVLVSGSKTALIREPESFGDLVARQRIPEWI